ncbi:cysteine desulfurase [Candidatus Saccharibacteria bacterium]|nr:cysteine desulfurase [Candidatus Saccharibacteria bacterium]
MIYLDYSATSPLLPSVAEKMKEIIDASVEGRLGNPSSLHSAGVFSKNLLETAREQVASLLNCSPEEIIFTSGGSESNNTVIRSFENSPILASEIEHPSVLEPAKRFGGPFLAIPVDNLGRINIDFVEKHLKTYLHSKTEQNRQKTEQTQKNLKNHKKNTQNPVEPPKKILISVMLANNETGVLEPISELTNLVEKYRNQGLPVFLHADATQALGKIDINLQELKVDYLTCSSHKIGGPVGIGALFARNSAPFSPLIFGGAQEKKRRAGTSNILLASGFGEAARIAKEKNTPLLFEASVRPLKSYLESELKKLHKNLRVLTPSSPELSLPNILNVSISSVEGESTQLYLDLEKIAVSTGSACASGDIAPSHVIMAITSDPEIAHDSVRFSLGLDTKKSDIETLLEKLPPIISRLEDLSTLKPTIQKKLKNP